MKVARGGWDGDESPPAYNATAWFHVQDPACNIDCQTATYFAYGMMTRMAAFGDWHPVQQWELSNIGDYDQDSLLKRLLEAPFYRLVDKVRDSQSSVFLWS